MTDSEGIDYEINSFYEHMVSRYTGLSMLEVENLDIVLYLSYRRDAFIYRMSQTEKGREYLSNAYRLDQTTPDRKSLRDQFGEEG
jgi:hypothetical protein